jgi:hypothetical protein
VPRYIVVDAAALKAAVLYEADTADEVSAVQALPAGVRLPTTGVYVLRRAGVGPRYVREPSDPDDVMFVVKDMPPET